MADPRFCVSLVGSTVDELTQCLHSLPAEFSLVELRADRLTPDAWSDGSWKALLQPGREVLFTWRSPGEGGASLRPANAYAVAQEAGCRWIDVEARALEQGDPQSVAVEASRRWVSLHLSKPPRSAPELLEIWSNLREQPAALHKLVALADTFEVNEWILDLIARTAGDPGQRTIFAQGWVGHASRILGAASGNDLTFVAPDAAGSVAPGQPTVREASRLRAVLVAGSRPRFYGVVGNPAHASRSPELHNAVFAASAEPAYYLPLECPEPEPVFAWVRSGRLAGVSVTTPFKDAAYQAADDLEPLATQARAVNTLWIQGERLQGANTDAEATRDLLQRSGCGSGARVAVLGTGGAARAAAVGAAARGCEVTLVSRSPADRPSNLPVISWEACAEASWDAIINASPVGVTLPIPRVMTGSALHVTTFMDLAYGAEPSAWQAVLHGRVETFIDGLEFLAEQATGQLHRWTGRVVSASEMKRGYAT